MSELLTRLGEMIRRLTPAHEIAERGLSEQSAGRLYELLLDLEVVLEHAEAEAEDRKPEPVEDEQDQPSRSRKPPV